MIEVIDAVHAGGDVARADRIDEVVGARVVPAVPHVELRGHVAAHSRRLRALEHHLFARRDRYRLPAGRRHRRLSGAPRHERAAGLRHVDAVVSGALDRERRLRGIDLHRTPRIDVAEVERDVAGGDLDLQEIRLVVHETELGVTPGSHERARAYLKLKVAPIASVELVPGRQCGVDLRGSPVLGARTEIRDLAVGVAQPGRGATDCAIVALSRPDGPRAESHLGDEHQAQNSRDPQLSTAPEHEEPSFPFDDSSCCTGQPGVAFHRGRDPAPT